MQKIYHIKRAINASPSPGPTQSEIVRISTSTWRHNDVEMSFRRQVVTISKSMNGHLHILGCPDRATVILRVFFYARKQREGEEKVGAISNDIQIVLFLVPVLRAGLPYSLKPVIPVSLSDFCTRLVPTSTSCSETLFVACLKRCSNVKLWLHKQACWWFFPSPSSCRLRFV